MSPKKQPVKKPIPDIKSATRNALERIANWVDEEATWEQMFGLSPTARTTREEAEALAEAKKLVVNYVRMGAQAQVPQPPANVVMKKGA